MHIRLFKQNALSLVEFSGHFGLQRNGDMLLAVEHIHRHLIRKVVLDHIIDDVKTCLNGDFLDAVAVELFQLFISQVIDKVLLGSSRLYGEGLLLRVNDNAVTVETFTELLIGEIHLTRNKFIVRLGWLDRSGLDLYGLDDRLEVCQHVLRRLLNLSLLTFVIEAIGSVLEFARFHAAIRTVGNHRRTLHEQGSTDSAHVPAFLLTWCPAKETAMIRIHHRMKSSSVPRQASIFTDSYTVAVQSHGNTAICIAGMNEASGQIEVIGEDCGEGIVGFLVG